VRLIVEILRYTTYCSRVMTITILHWPPAKSSNFHVFWGKGVKFYLSNPKRHFFGGNDV